MKLFENFQSFESNEGSEIASHPGFYVGVMIVADVVDRKHRSVFLGMPAFRPEAGKICGPLRRYAQHHYRCALIVVNQRPKFAARVSKGPFCYDIFSRFRVALHGIARANECFGEKLGNARLLNGSREIL